MVNFVFGAQWGDEGKGKLVDLLAKKADYVVRFHGGNNAGHTVVINGKRYPFHLVPSGILNPNVIGVIANGTVIDSDILTNEIEMLKKEGIDVKEKLIISPRCHLIMPYHKALDEAYENARGKNKLGTTKRGIGPCYSDKVSYNGLRVCDLLNFETFIEKFKFQVKIKNEILKTFNVSPIEIKDHIEKYRIFIEIIKPSLKDTFSLFQKALKNKKNILLEGAHGVMLDNDWSPYPFATGSNVVSGAINIGAGIPVKAIDNVWAVIKAYTSRVGGGPLPTELFDDTADLIREKGIEYGTTTGRPRRIGWLDLEAVKFACEITDASDIAITKIDVLSGIPNLKICVGYKLGSKNVTYSQCTAEDLARVKPIYETFKGWKERIDKVTRLEELPNNCKEYLKFIYTFLKIPIKIVSTGAERNSYLKVQANSSRLIFA